MKRPPLPELVHVKVCVNEPYEPFEWKEFEIPYKWLVFNGYRKYTEFSWNQKYIKTIELAVGYNNAHYADHIVVIELELAKKKIKLEHLMNKYLENTNELSGVLQELAKIGPTRIIESSIV